jgi:hypothetical protein
MKAGSRKRSSIFGMMEMNTVRTGVIGNADRLSSTSSSPNSALRKGNQIYKNMRNISNLYKYEPDAALGVKRGDDQLRLGLKKVQYIAPIAAQNNLPVIKQENVFQHPS